MKVAAVAYLFLLNTESTPTAATVQNLVDSLKTWINQQLEDYKIPCWINLDLRKPKAAAFLDQTLWQQQQV